MIRARMNRAWPLLLAAGLLALLAAGCDNADNDPAETPTPTAIPTATPPPAGNWGFVSGQAEVMVTGLTDEPVHDKEAIWCLGNPEDPCWIEVQHRSGKRFQIKGGLAPGSGCEDEQPFGTIGPLDNGIWLADWGTDGHVTITAPTGSAYTLWIPGGQFAFQHCLHSACGGYALYVSPNAIIEVLSMTGEVGYPTGCNR